MMRGKGNGKRIGLYGGTFDPIHFGHLNLAVELMERHQLDLVYFSPAYLSPHKMDQHPISSKHRLKMVELAIADYDQFQLLDVEIDRQGPSYTIDTIHYLRFRHQEDKLFLLLGNDAIPTFHKWHRVEEIVAEAEIVIGNRVTLTPSFPTEAPRRVREALAHGLTLTSMVEISATRLRERLSQKLICQHLLPKIVLDYIYTNHLYS